LLQIEKARKLDITEEVYYEIIRQKTATLIASCCASGANSVGADKTTIEKMRQFGEYTGIAFQIKDDLFDYGGSSEEIGKPTGIDIKEKKLTLPLIYTLGVASEKDKKFIISTVKHDNESRKKVKEVIALVVQYGGITYTQKAMHDFKNKALAILDELEQNEAVDGLRQLVTYVTERKN